MKLILNKSSKSARISQSDKAMELLTKEQLSKHIGVPPQDFGILDALRIAPIHQNKTFCALRPTRCHARIKNATRTKYGPARGIAESDL